MMWLINRAAGDMITLLNEGRVLAKGYSSDIKSRRGEYG